MIDRHPRGHCVRWMMLMIVVMAFAFTLSKPWMRWLQFSVGAASFLFHGYIVWSIRKTK